MFFHHGGPPQLGLPVLVVQGYKLLSAQFEYPAFRAPCPSFCVATWLIDIGLAWGVPKEQLLHVPVGLDPAFHEPVLDGPRPIDVAMLYTEHPSKGSAYGVRVLEELHRRRPEVRVAVFGFDGDPALLPPWIEHRSSPKRSALLALYESSKVFLQPARREGFGLTSVEAMARGSALVSTDNGGSRDYAFDGDSALLVPRDDPAAAAAVVHDLLGDDDRRVTIARRAKEVSRRFDWDLAAATLEQHLERYLADPATYQQPPADAPMFLDDDW